MSYPLGNGNPKEIIYISGNENPEKILIFQETELSNTSGNGTFLIFRERYIQNPSIFRTRSIFRTLTYLEVEEYSEP